MRKQYFEVVNREKFNAEILEICQEYGLECAEEIIKLIEVSTTVANKLNVVNEQLASIKQLSKELTS